MNYQRDIYYKIKGEDNSYVRVMVYYSIGGYSYFTYKTNERGFYISAEPIEICKGDGYTSICSQVFSGVKAIYKRCQRKNKKDFWETCEYARENALGIISKWLPNIEVEPQPTSI